MIRYAHTNIIAKDAAKLIEFYKDVFQCKSTGDTRDLRGEWLDKLTGIPNAHITGEHLTLPGYPSMHSNLCKNYESNPPTLEIFSYDTTEEAEIAINKCGIAHLAFEVDDVEQTLKLLLEKGGSQIGELVRREYPNGKKAVLVYAADCEGNIVELQSWS